MDSCRFDIVSEKSRQTRRQNEERNSGEWMNEWINALPNKKNKTEPSVQAVCGREQMVMVNLHFSLLKFLISFHHLICRFFSPFELWRFCYSVCHTVMRLGIIFLFFVKRNWLAEEMSTITRSIAILYLQMYKHFDTHLSKIEEKQQTRKQNS